MLSPSDFNNAVPQFTNGDYASNPINPQYIAEPDAENYNRGTEPLQTLPAQWWNWFLNRFTNRFNKVNVYVKNIFNELAQVLSIFNITPDGTEQTPTTSQLKTVFESCYPQYVKTVTTGTAVGCIPTVGTALGTTNNNILVTDSTGKLKPSGITVGTAAGCDASLFARETEINALYGNVVGTALGTAAVGTATTFARSDHVHPFQSGIPNTGFATCCFTWVSTPSSFAGSPSDWAHYLISSHGDGSSYYNYIIREPFTAVPQYSRMVNGTQSGWYNFITDENIGSQWVCFANNAGCASQANHATESICAGLAECSTYLNIAGSTLCGNFKFSGQTGQPAWLWGTNDGCNMYVWNPSNFHVSCADSAARALAANYSQAGYLKISTCSFIGGNVAQIYYCAYNYDMPWLTQSYVVMNGIKAGSSCQFDFSTFSELNRINTADGKTLGLLCVDNQWHLLASCVDGTGGIFTNTYYVQLAALVA